MSLYYTPYVLPLVAAALITALLALLAVQRRHVAGAKPFLWLMVALTTWLLCYALQVAGTDLATIIFWSNACYLSIAFLPIAWLAFALEYSNRGRWLTPLSLGLLAIVPSITQIMVWTNDSHQLFRTNLSLKASGSILSLHTDSQIWFWVHTAYSYLLIGLGILVLALVLVRSSSVYRKQAATLLVGALVPLVANAVFIFSLKQSFPLDPTPFSLTFTGLMFALGLFRFRLLDIMPAARDAVIQGMSDGILVLDTHNRIIDFNPAAQRIVGRTAAELIGQPADNLFPEHPDLIKHYPIAEEVQAEITTGTDSARCYYDVRLSPLHNRQQRSTGWLIVLRDITERKHAENALERWITQFQVMPEVAREIAAGLELEDLLQHTADLIRDRLELYHVAIFLIDKESGYARLKAVSGEGADGLLERRYQLRVDAAGIMGAAISTGQFQVVDDTSADAFYAWRSPLSQTRSEIALPLRVGQQIIGILNVHSTQVAAFDETLIAVLQTVSDQLAVAIENAGLLEQMQVSMRELEHTYQRYTKEAWRSLSGGAGQPLGYRYRGLGVEPIVEFSSEMQQALQQGQPVVTAVQPETVDAESNAVDALSVPIAVREQVIGALNLRFQDQQVSPDVVLLIQDVANRLALTLESARLYQDTQRRAARERMAGHVTARMRESLDADTILQSAVREIREALGLHDVMIQLGDSKGDVTSCSEE